MAKWTGEKVDKSQINYGQQYIDGDGLNADDFNNIVNNTLYAIKIVESVSKNIKIQIDDGISTKELFVNYLNNNNINIGDYVGQIIIFESNDGGDLWEFIVIPTNYDDEGILMCSDSTGIYKLYKNIDGYFTHYINDTITGNLDNLQTTNKTNLVSAINEVNTKTNNNAKVINKLDLSLIDLKEALYGYVLDTSDVEIENTIPNTINGYNLVDNVRGLVKEVKGNTIKCNNLLNISDVSSTTINSITYSISNGVFTANGTSTAQCLIKQTNLVLSAGTYTVSAIDGQSGAYFQFIENNNFHNCYGNNKFTFTLTQETTCIYRYIIDSGKTLSNQKISAMLNVGSTALPFEPYFDGLKNVDYQGLKIWGKNLFDKDNYISFENNVTFVPSGWAEVPNRIVIFIELKPNKVYTYTGLPKTALGDAISTNCNFINYKESDNKYSYTFTTTDTYKYLMIGIINNETELLNDIIINVGSNALPYSPYKAPTTILSNLGTITLNGVGTTKDKIVITKNKDNEYYTATKVSNVLYLDNSNFDNLLGTNANGLKYYLILNTKVTDLSNIITTGETISEYQWGELSESPNKACVSFDTNSNLAVLFIPSGYTLETIFNEGLIIALPIATPTETILSITLTENDVMPLLELGGSVDIINDNNVQGSTIMEMVYKLINN